MNDFEKKLLAAKNGVAPAGSSVAVRMKYLVWNLLEKADEKDEVGSRIVDIIMIGLIVVNVACLMLETMKELSHYHSLFITIEEITLWVFLIEYILRLWSCTVHPSFERPFKGRLAFACRPLSIIDLIAILPVVVPLLTSDTTVVRVIRLIRVLRLLKISRYSESIALIGQVFRKASGIIAFSSLLLVVLVILVSTSIYNLEHEAQPDKFPDIPHSVWWTVVTLTTVGYGDVFPITDGGKILAMLSLIAGIGLVSLPSAALAGAFSEIWAEKVREEIREQQKQSDLSKG